MNLKTPSISIQATLLLGLFCQIRSSENKFINSDYAGRTLIYSNLQDENVGNIKKSPLIKEAAKITTQEDGPNLHTKSLVRKEEVKSYKNWRVISIHVPKTGQILSIFLKSISTFRDDAVVLGVKKSRDDKQGLTEEVQMAISPNLDLTKSLSQYALPPLCSLDDENQQEQQEQEQQPRQQQVIPEEKITGNVLKCPANDHGKTETGSNVIKMKTILSDLGSMLKSSNESSAANQMMSWDTYHRYDVIVDFITGLAENYTTVEYVKIATTEEGRNVFALVFAASMKRMLKIYTNYLQNVKSTESTFKEGGEGEKAKSKSPKKQQQNKHKAVKTKRQSKKTMKSETKILRRNLGLKRKDDQLTKGVKSTKQNSGKKKKVKPQVIFIEAGTHAREWISSAVGTYLSKQLADAGKTFLKLATFVIVPLVNPDGYEYSHTTDRYWRKNRGVNADTSCVGVDLNRNWAKGWGDPAGSSDDPCDYQYRGTAPFSEPETTGLKHLADAYRKNMKLFLNLHSYGQYVLHPWSFTKVKPPKVGKLKNMARKLKNRLHDNGDYVYTHGQSSDMLYIASGVTDDYMYDMGVPFVFTIELPDENSFLIHESEIKPIGEHVWSSLVCLVGDLIKTKIARSYCRKRLVTVEIGGIMYTSWVNKKIPLEKAKDKVKQQYQNKLTKNNRIRNIQDLAKKRKI